MRKKYTIHKKRKYTKKNKIKKSKNKIKYTKKKYTKKKYKKKIKTKRKQRGGMDDAEEFDPYGEIVDLDYLRDLIRDKDVELEEKDAELEEKDNQLQKAAELGQRLVAKNGALEEQLSEEEIDSENLSVGFEDESYERQRLEGERESLNEDITVRQGELEREKQELERKRISEKEEFERKKIELNKEKKELQEILEGNISEFSGRLNKKQSDIDKLNEEKTNLQGKNDELSVSLVNEQRLCETNFEKEKKESNRRISEIEDKLREEELEKARVQEQVNLKQRELDMKSMESSESERKLKECSSELDRIKDEDVGPSLADELGFVNQLEDNPSNEEMRNLKNENDRLKNEIKILKDEGIHTREAISKLANI